MKKYFSIGKFTSAACHTTTEVLSELIAKMVWPWQRGSHYYSASVLPKFIVQLRILFKNLIPPSSWRYDAPLPTKKLATGVEPRSRNVWNNVGICRRAKRNGRASVELIPKHLEMLALNNISLGKCARENRTQCCCNLNEGSEFVQWSFNCKVLNRFFNVWSNPVFKRL